MQDPAMSYESGEDKPTSSNRPRANSILSSTGSVPKMSSKVNKKKSSSLPAETVEYLKNWMMSPEHIAHPYPTEQEKAKIMEDTGIELKQLTNWFVNNRKRFWKPRVEARLKEQAQASPAESPVSTVLIKPDYKSTSSRRDSFSGDVSLRGQDQVDSGDSQSGTSFSMSQYGSVNIISEGASSSSECGSVISQEADDFLGGEATVDGNSLVEKSELVDVHICRPSNYQIPTVDNVAIDIKPADQDVLRTYQKCTIAYRVRADDMKDENKIQSLRESEVHKLKNQYLGLFLEERNVVTPTRKRNSQEIVSPRLKYRRVSTEMWKEACLTARNSYDASLPSLEEAAQLFGFAS